MIEIRKGMICEIIPQYRVKETFASSTKIKTGETVKEIERAVEIPQICRKDNFGKFSKNMINFQLCGLSYKNRGFSDVNVSKVHFYAYNLANARKKANYILAFMQNPPKEIEGKKLIGWDCTSTKNTFRFFYEE